MSRPIALLVIVGCVASFFSSCANQEKPVQQTSAFGEPMSTIPWNQPQKWEGGGAGLNALRSGEDN